MVARIGIKLTPGRLDEGLERAAKLSPKEMTELVVEIVEIGRTNIIKRTPVGFSRAARGGWGSEIRGRGTSRVTGIITNPVLHIPPLEEGRAPGRRPPIEALIPWVGSKLGIPPGPARRSVAFLIARKIGRSGTEGAHMIEEGWDATRDEIRPRLKEAGVRIVRRI